jgi:hypothetical protein
MSLVGSLEDLGLADILQIVSLARKSGRLLLRSDDGEGWIALQDGLVRGAAVKGQSEGLRALLVGAGHVEADVFDRAASDTQGEDRQLEAALLGSGAVTDDSLQAARRGGVERAVMRMFGWRSGEFRFEVREDIDASEPGSLLATGLNTQYLAMEATRLGDELSREPEEEALPVADSGEPAADALLFSGEAEPADAPAPEAPRADATNHLALASVEAADAEPEPALAAQILVSEEPSEPAPVAVRLDAASAAPPAAARASASAPSELHLVALDADLGALEWLKASVEGVFRRVHIFQHAGAALERVRQYLRRGQLPVVAISSRMQPDTAAGVAGADAMVARLRALAPRMPLVALVGPGKEADAPPGVDAALARPISPGLDPATWEVHRPAAERVRRALATYRSRAPGAAPPRGGPSLASVKAASERLRDEVAPGEILTLALDFAAQTFSRTALFMLRDEVVEGIGARGLDRSGGPTDVRSLQLLASERPEIVARVLRERRALRASPASARDRAFLARLGSSCPNEVYLAPIESAGCVVALLYADNLPEGAALGDTTALEIVLHEAGLALDRASLERALSGA